MPKNHDYSTPFILILSVFLAVFRFSYLSFRYIPYLDDYVQYFYYPSFPNPLQTIFFGGPKILFTRPLAGLCDRFLWSFFVHNLGIAVVIISFLYGISGVLFYKTFETLNLHPSPIFLVIYLVAPLNTEGTYWLSASTRIVASLFLIALSCHALVKRQTTVFALFSFLSVWFYEQTAFLSIFLGISLSLFSKQPKSLVFPLLNFIVLSGFYLILGKYSDNADRLTLTFCQKNFSSLGTQVYEFLIPLSSNLVTNGFRRGLDFLIQNHMLWWLFLLVILASLFFEVSKTQVYTTSTKKLFLGLFLTFVPFLPFLISSNENLNFRNFVPCLLGIALIFEDFLVRISRSLCPTLCSVLVCIFSIVAACEVADYNHTATADLNLAIEISQALPKDAKTFKYQINTPDYYPQSAPKNDHIMSMTASDWGPTGIVRTLSGNKRVEITLDKNPKK